MISLKPILLSILASTYSIFISKFSFYNEIDIFAKVGALK